MAAKDKIHDQVKNALIKDGWMITHDPFFFKFGQDQLFADLAAQRSLLAERQGEKIIVEIKSFIGVSAIQEFKLALGQYMLYLVVLKRTYPQYRLFTAVSHLTYETIFQRDVIQLALQEYQIPLIIINIKQEEVVAWKS